MRQYRTKCLLLLARGYTRCSKFDILGALWGERWVKQLVFLRQSLKENIETVSHERLTRAFKGDAEGVLNRLFWESYGVNSEQHSECSRQSLKERSHRRLKDTTTERLNQWKRESITKTTRTKRLLESRLTARLRLSPNLAFKSCVLSVPLLSRFGV